MTDRERKALEDALRAWREICAATKFQGDDGKWLPLYFQQVTNHTYLLHGIQYAN